MMKKLFTLLSIGLFIINTSSQEAKPVAIEKAEKEYCCAAKVTNDKAMSAEDLEQRQIKCKAEGKKYCPKKA
jgi:hypothetical protein